MKTPPLTAQARISTPLGPLTLAATDQGLAWALFDGQKHHPCALDAPTNAAHPLLARAAREIADYFAGRRRAFGLPLDPPGTPFQQAVWQALRGLDCGATCSYGEIAARIGRPRAVRAVGAAIGRNPLSIVVPCHRVVGADGALTGYAGGLPRKQALLALEAMPHERATAARPRLERAA